MNVGSRKEVHSLIKRKVVTVNGELVTTPKQQVKEDDLVVVDGNEIAYQQYHYFLLNLLRLYNNHLYQPVLFHFPY